MTDLAVVETIHDSVRDLLAETLELQREIIKLQGHRTTLARACLLALRELQQFEDRNAPGSGIETLGTASLRAALEEVAKR